MQKERKRTMRTALEEALKSKETNQVKVQDRKERKTKTRTALEEALKSKGMNQVKVQEQKEKKMIVQEQQKRQMTSPRIPLEGALKNKKMKVHPLTLEEVREKETMVRIMTTPRITPKSKKMKVQEQKEKERKTMETMTMDQVTKQRQKERKPMRTPRKRLKKAPRSEEMHQVTVQEKKEGKALAAAALNQKLGLRQPARNHLHRRKHRLKKTGMMMTRVLWGHTSLASSPLWVSLCTLNVAGAVVIQEWRWVLQQQEQRQLTESIGQCKFSLLRILGVFLCGRDMNLG